MCWLLVSLELLFESNLKPLTKPKNYLKRVSTQSEWYKFFCYGCNQSWDTQICWLTAPQPRKRDKSFPVPSGRMETGGGGMIRSLSISERIQPTWNREKKDKMIYPIIPTKNFWRYNSLYVFLFLVFILLDWIMLTLSLSTCQKSTHFYHYLLIPIKNIIVFVVYV